MVTCDTKINTYMLKDIDHAHTIILQTGSYLRMIVNSGKVDY